MPSNSTIKPMLVRVFRSRSNASPTRLASNVADLSLLQRNNEYNCKVKLVVAFVSYSSYSNQTPKRLPLFHSSLSSRNHRARSDAKEIPTHPEHSQKHLCNPEPPLHTPTSAAPSCSHYPISTPAPSKLLMEQ